MVDAAQNLFDDITSAFQQGSGFSDFKNVSQFHKKIDFTYLGISTQQLRGILKPFNHKIKALPVAAALKLSHQFYKTHVLEYAAAATYILDLHKKDILPKHFSQLDKMLDEFRSWG